MTGEFLSKLTHYEINIFTHLKLCLAIANHNFKWVIITKIYIIWIKHQRIFKIQCHFLQITSLTWWNPKHRGGFCLSHSETPSTEEAVIVLPLLNILLESHIDYLFLDVKYIFYFVSLSAFFICQTVIHIPLSILLLYLLQISQTFVIYFSIEYQSTYVIYLHLSTQPSLD